MKIGIFDSGIGGLTVLKEIIKKYPNASYLYYGDTLHLPYGEKSKKELLEYSCKIIDFFIEQNVDKIIIACGTISSTIYDELTSICDIELINVVDATIDAIKKKNLKEIAVLATPKTIESHTFSKKLEGTNVLEVACPKFVPYLEKGIGNKDDMLKEYLEQIKEKHIGNIILGCTHYPLLQYDIKKYFDYDVTCYNMGEFVADTIQIKENNYNLKLYFSKLDEIIETNVKKIVETDFEIIKKVL